MSEKNRKNRRRDQRLKNPKNIVLTQRDMQIVETVYLGRVFSQDQLAQLFFNNASKANRRLRALYDHNFLDRVFLNVRGGIQNSPVLYMLYTRGKDELSGDGADDFLERTYPEVNWQPSYNKVGDEFLKHALGISEFRVQVMIACREQGYRFTKWIGETTLKADYDRVKIPDRKTPVAVIPDSYFAIKVPVQNPTKRETATVHFFLEIDRRTEAHKAFARKIPAYLAYFNSQAIKDRFGVSKARVLTVTTSDRRAQNLKKTIEDAGGKGWFWITSIDQLTPETIFTEPVWYKAGSDQKTNLIDQPQE